MKHISSLPCAALAACLLLAPPLLAQPGTADQAFTENGGSGANDDIGAMALQADGKILIGGFLTTYNGVSRDGLARLMPDGTLDPDFTVGAGFNQYIHNIMVQPDGRIVVSGEFTSYQGQPQGGLVRLNADGTLDALFNTGAELGNPGRGYALVLQPDGKILIGGDFQTFRGAIVNNMTRALPDGLRDTGFTCSTNGVVHAVALQPDGKILLGGDFTMVNGTARNRLARVNPDGTVDATFTIGAGFTGPQFQNRIVNAITLQTDGKVLVGGCFINYDGAPHGGLIRLNEDGSHDPTFDVGVGCQAANAPRVDDIVLLPDGKMFVGGFFYGIDGDYLFEGFAHLTSEGAWIAFGTMDVQFMSGEVHDLLVQADGKVLAGGAFSYFDNDISTFYLVRFETDFSTSIAEALPGKLSISPNPATDRITLTGLPAEAIRLELRQVDGRLVRNVPVNRAADLDVSGLAAGTWILSALDRTGLCVAAARLVKH